MNRHVLMGAVAALTIAVSATEVRAATITLDFASALYNGANGVAAFGTVDQGVAVTLSTSTGNLRHNGQGFGVDSSVLAEDPNEIGRNELLLTGFAPAQYVHSVSIERLFGNDIFGPEEGQYSINGGAFVSFFGNSSTGLFTLNLEQGGITSLSFRGTGNIISDDDFTVRAISIEAPEPASMILLGTGLAGAFMQRRRKKSQSL